jgi:hypothetical protein
MTSLRDELESFAANGREAYGIADRIFAEIIAALRRGKRFATVSPSEIELLLADARAAVEERLFEKLCGRIHLDDVGTIIDGVEI